MGKASKKAGRPPERRSRRVLWIVGVLAVLAVAATVAGTAGWSIGSLLTRKPSRNVLLITVDTTRADYLGCYGGTATKTPNMDRLAGEGALFSRCATSSVMTLPSHCSIMTGLFPFVHGVHRNGVDFLSPAADTLAEEFHAGGAATAASVASFVLHEGSGIGQGFDEYRGVPRPRGPTDPSELQRKGDQVCDDALALLRARAKDKFFLWVHFYDAHYPYESATHHDVTSPAAYADEVAYMDGQIGRLLDGLRDLGLEENTLVVLVADHGEGLGDHEETQHGYFLYSTCARVPLLVRCPGVVAPGTRIDALVRTVDVAPTILDVAGLPALAKASGVSLARLLGGKVADPGLSAYSETAEPYTRLRLSALRALWSGHWKYVWSTEPQLFDLDADAGELHNVIAQNAEQANGMQRELRKLLADAPPPLAAPASAPLPSAELSRLESLGYVGLGDSPRAANTNGLQAAEPVGPDPHVHVAAVAAYERARELMGHNRFAEVVSILRGVLAELPQALAAQRDLAYSLGELGQREEAAAEYEKAVAVAPEDTRGRVEYATLLMKMGRWERAISQAKQGAVLAPRDFAAHSILGECYARLSRWDEAAASLETAVALQPQVINTREALGQVYMQQRQFPKALACFQSVLSMQPNSTVARNGLADARREMGMR